MNLSYNGFKIWNLAEDNCRISFFFFFWWIDIFKFLLFYIFYNLCFLFTPLVKILESPLLTRGFSSLLKGFPHTSYCYLYFSCTTFVFSRFYDVKAFIFIILELFHQNVLLNISYTFSYEFTNLTCTYTHGYVFTYHPLK